MALFVSHMRHFFQVSIVIMLIGGWFAQMVPFPVTTSTVPSAEKQYPCQGGTCGCRTAKQCWSSCCCTTREYRIAWAKKRGIAIPIEQIGEMREKPASAVSCCSQKHNQVVACSQGTSSCCGKKVKVEQQDSSELPEFPLLSAWECQGNSALVAISTLNTTDDQTEWLLPIQPLVCWMTLENQVAVLLADQPMLPPPECC